MLRTISSALLCSAFILAAGLFSVTAKLNDWPLIHPLSWSGEMDMLAPPTLIPILSPQGNILYRIYCSSDLAKPEPDWLIHGDNYGGDFVCLFTDATPSAPSHRATLLNYDSQDTSPYHFNLASFGWQELLGIDCWNNPVWGADRTFYLRGMRLRIHVVAMKIELYNDKKQDKTYQIIRRVTADITATPDKSADTPLARKPTQSEPAACMQ